MSCHSLQTEKSENLTGRGKGSWPTGTGSSACGRGTFARRTERGTVPGRNASSATFIQRSTYPPIHQSKVRWDRHVYSKAAQTYTFLSSGRSGTSPSVIQQSTSCLVVG